VVCMRDGYDIWRSGDPHKGSHGSLSRGHMLVPFAINYRIREGPLRTVDVFPTIAHILGWDVPKDLDGIPRL
jgi:arylsulfatase A-like enzyme